VRVLRVRNRVWFFCLFACFVLSFCRFVLCVSSASSSGVLHKLCCGRGPPSTTLLYLLWTWWEQHTTTRQDVRMDGCSVVAAAAAAEGVFVMGPGDDGSSAVGRRGRSLQVMLSRRRKHKARRKKRTESFAFQMCFAGALLLLVMAISSFARKTGWNCMPRSVALTIGLFLVCCCCCKKHICILKSHLK